MTEHCVRRHVLVTGASSGIGQATAIRLAGAGDHVFATVRSQADADEFNQSGVTPVTMDVTNMHQIQAVFDTISDHTTTLNTLINNAGIGLTAPLEFVPLGSLRQVYEVNVIGQVAVIQAMLPLLRAASGVIVMIGTVGDRIQIPFGGPLASSKQAIRSLSGTLRLELEPWGIHVVLVQPGSIHTPAIDKTIPEFPEEMLRSLSPDAVSLYGTSYTAMTTRFRRSELAGDPPSVVADAILRITRKKRPKANYLVGKDSRRLASIARLPPIVLDQVRRRMFDSRPAGADEPSR